MSDIYQFDVLISLAGKEIYKYYYSTSKEEVENNVKDMMYGKYYTILSIEQYPACEGCRYEAPGQDAHDVCPHGCLHDKDSCYICKNYYP
tara:strand:- start:296 stop:565 length:270 start_codon:yes stop_codon:yes gene_type:complete